MITSIINVVLNGILDYIMAAVLNMGISGIAYASLISELATVLILAVFIMTRSPIFRFHSFRFDTSVMKNSILNGASEFIGEMSGCLSMFAFNYVIMKYIGTDGVTAFTIGGYIEFLFSMILIGFGQGASPLISFAFGAKDCETARKIRQDTSRYVLAAGIVLYAITFFSAGWYSTLFVQDAAVAEMVVTGIRILAVSFLFSGYNCIASFYFTSIGKAKESAVISSARGLIVLMIAIFTLPVLLGMNGVWLVSPVTESISLLISRYYVSKDAKIAA
jgi:Na+-driven multidrug efflux pump